MSEISGDKRKAMFCQLWSPRWHMFWAQPGHLPILILNGQNIAIPSFVPPPVVGGEFSCPGGAAASAIIHQQRITHDAAICAAQIPHKENMANRTNWSFASETSLSGLFSDSNFYLYSRRYANWLVQKSPRKGLMSVDNHWLKET